MSKRVRQLNLTIYQNILAEAIKKHSQSSEPIPEINDEGLERVESCLIVPFMKFEGHYFCRGFVNKATNLFYCFNKNHCLVNGNKRMACLTLSAFCDINGYAFLIPEDELYTLAKTVVNSDTADMVKTLRKIRHTLKIYLLKL